MIKSRIAPNIERNRIESLTGLRFFAALAVLLCHYQALAPPTSLSFLLDAGGHGVLLFFMLSGFVLTHRYDRLQATASSNAWLRSSVYSYVLARVARVVPLYWLVLGVTVVVYFASNFVYALGPQPEGSIGIGLSLLVNFLALQSWIPSVSVQQFWNAPGWSISCEMFFYACFPWLIRRLTLNGSTWSFVRVTVGFAFAFFIYAAVLHIFSAWTRLSLEVGFRLPLFGLFPFILGILIHRRMRNGFSSKFAPEVVFCVAVSVWVSVVWGLSEVRQDSETHSALWVRWCVMWGAVVPLIALVLGSVACMQGRVAQFLSHPGLVLLGNASFALYLMHWLPLGVLLNIFGPQSMSWFQITFISALLVLGSIVIYLGFEAPIRRWVLVKFS